MAADRSGKATAADGMTAVARAASEIGATVADQVRQLIAEAERAAEGVHSQALGHASADRAAIRQDAVRVAADIEALEAKVSRTLRALREEAMEIAAEMDGHAAMALPSEREAEAERSSPVERAPSAAEHIAQPTDGADDAEPAPSAESEAQHVAQPTEGADDAEFAPSAESEADHVAQPNEGADDAELLSGHVDHPGDEEACPAKVPAEDIAEAQPAPSEQAVEPAPDAAAAAQHDAAEDAPTREPGMAADDQATVSESGDVHEASDRPAKRRGGLLGRLRRGAPPTCAVCSRDAAPDENVAHWRRAGNMSLCPACQAEGWQLSERGTVPSRSTYQREAR